MTLRLNDWTPCLGVPAPRLDVASDDTFDRWLSLPANDHRTIEEFAEDGGRPVGPPNQYDYAPGALIDLRPLPTNYSAMRVALLDSRAAAASLGAHRGGTDSTGAR